jgi:hypothetical protein
MLFLRHMFTCFVNRKQPELKSHLWILSELLLTKGPSRYRRLLRYSIATCHPKMISRLKTARSTLFIQSLKNLPEFKYNAGPVRDRHLHEIQNDRNFLETIVNFKNTIPFGIIDISIPHMVALHHKLGPEDDLYNSATYMEFHNLFNQLLECFQTSLESLAVSVSPIPSQAEFLQHLGTVFVIGYTLLTIAKSRAFQIYLTNIEPLFEPPPMVKKDEGQRGEQGKQGKVEDHRDQEGEVEDQEGEGEVSDDERDVEIVLKYATEEDQPSWSKRCKAWLLLMVVHFDSVDTLDTFVSKEGFPYKAITFNILTPPIVDTQLLPWGELFTDLELKFPTSDPDDPVGPTNADLHKYLIDAFKVSSKASSQKVHVNRAQTAWHKNEDGAFVGHMTTACTEIKDEVLLSEAQEILSLAQAITSTSTPSTSTPQNREVVTEKIKSLHKKIAALRLPFNLGASFGGALHCETYLTMMIYLREKGNMRKYASYETLFNEMQVNLVFFLPFPHLNPISCDDRIMDQVLEYPNYAVRFAGNFSPSCSWNTHPSPNSS